MIHVTHVLGATDDCERCVVKIASSPSVTERRLRFRCDFTKTCSGSASPRSLPPPLLLPRFESPPPRALFGPLTLIHCSTRLCLRLGHLFTHTDRQIYTQTHSRICCRETYTCTWPRWRKSVFWGPGLRGKECLTETTCGWLALLLSSEVCESL